jgi:heme exporter protein CcmD
MLRGIDAMFDLGPHAGFIIASYLVTVVVLIALIWTSVAHFKTAKRLLAAAQTSSVDGKSYG